MRQRIAGVLLIFGLLCAWVGLTTLVIRQTLLIPDQLPTYATKLLKNPTIRNEIATLVTGTLRNSNTVLRDIPQSQLHAAIDQSLTNPAVASQFASVALQIQQHLIGKQSGPIIVGGPVLSSSVAKAVAGNNPVAEQAIAQIPMTYTISSSSIPSFGKYYQKISKLINTSLLFAALLLFTSLVISAKRRKTLRKIGIWLVGFSIFEVSLFWLIPTYLLRYLHAGYPIIVAAILSASFSSVMPLYLTIFGSGLALTLISFLI